MMAEGAKSTPRLPTCVAFMGGGGNRSAIRLLREACVLGAKQDEGTPRRTRANAPSLLHTLDNVKFCDFVLF